MGWHGDRGGMSRGTGTGMEMAWVCQWGWRGGGGRDSDGIVLGTGVA